MQKTLFVAATTAILFMATSAHATDYHLNPSNGQGDAIQKTLNQLKPGDTLYLAGGTYEPVGGVYNQWNNNKNSLDVRPTDYRGQSGTASQWITVRNKPGEKPVLKLGKYNTAANSGGGGFALHDVSYWRIEGLEIVAHPDADAYAGGLSASGSSHHVQFVNNVVHGFGASGIEAGYVSHILIEGNTVYDNSWRSKNGTSGINLSGLQMESTDNSGFGGALGNPGNAYAMIVRNNRVYYNRNHWYAEGKGTGDDITDGNGIIVDYADETKFTGKTLIANNIVYNNGGAGIHIFKSSNVDVFHNTLYQNAWNANGNQLSNAGPVPDVPPTIPGSINRFFNNVVVGGNPNIKTGYYLNNGSEAFGANRGGQDAFNNGQWNKNLFFNTAPFQDFGGNILGYPYGSIIGNPLFVDAKLETTSAPTADFHIQANSPAINTGLSSSTTNITQDIDLNSRDSSPDLGADEFAGTPALVDHTLLGGTVTSNAQDNGGSEDKYKAFDNNIGTKWLGWGYSGTPYLQYAFANGAARRVTRYVITSGNDYPQRDPVSWVLQGSNDGSTGFVNLDIQSSQSFISRNMSKVYDFTNANSYKYYRLNITAIGSGTAAQISELRLWGPSSTSTPITISNASFESNMTGWSTWANTSANYAADYVETGGAYAGNNRLTHWMSSAYQVYTYRIITGLTNGSYTLRAWTKSSGGQASATMTVKNPTGGSNVSTNIPAGSSWTQQSVTFTINVPSGQTGQAEIGFWSSASANQWITVDDVTLTRN